MGDNRNPFKGPFKGKGANRRALRDLELELEKIHAEMDRVEERFNLVFQRPRPILLRRLRKRAYSLLWWRLAGKSGTYIRLFDSDAGDAVLATLMIETREVLKRFDQERIRLNFRAGVVGNAVQAYRIRARDISILEHFDLHQTRTEKNNLDEVDPDTVTSLYD